MLDLTTEFGRRVERRLREEQIIWLTTTGSDQTPQPRPVWFLWTGESFLIFSQPDAHKLRHIARNPRVALNLNTDGEGGDVVVFTGEAVVVQGKAGEDEIKAYVEKYAEGIKRNHMSPEEFAQAAVVAVRVKPTGLRGQ
jgi:PPOX class probable F420-dependent enzyme